MTGLPPLTEVSALEAMERLSSSEAPSLIGVRHHSPAMAAAIPRLLDTLRPRKIFLELAPDFQRWIPYLGHPETRAPVALAGVMESQQELLFYPLADFSPELATLRWAAVHEVPVIAFDAPLGGPSREQEEDGQELPSILDRLLARAEIPDAEELWDRMIEARAPGQEPEALRRAALLFGWIHRMDALSQGGIPARDLYRERAMRASMASHGWPEERGLVAVLGSFHAMAVLVEPGDPSPLDLSLNAKVVTSLVPYSFELLDSRSGYAAGIRDPVWQQLAFEALGDGRSIEDVLSTSVLGICRELRRMGHVAGVPDAREVVRLGSDLARLRALPGPGRRELVESVQSALGQGELLGRGRALARAMDRVLVGHRRGLLAPGTPRSGLILHLQGLLSALRLPGPDSLGLEAQTLRLDPLRSELDLRRQVALHRLIACGVPYAKLDMGEAAGGIETLTERWTLSWTSATEAMIEMAGIRGVTLAQAATGALLSEERSAIDEERYSAKEMLEAARMAAFCGLAGRCRDKLVELSGPFLEEATLPECLEACALLDRIERGHVPGLPRTAPEGGFSTALRSDDIRPFELPAGLSSAPFLAAAIRGVDGLMGSDDLDDAQALLALVRLYQEKAGTFETEGEPRTTSGRLIWSLRRMAEEGSPMMQGAAGVCLVTTGAEPASIFGVRIASWMDGSADAEGLAILSGRLRGLLATAGARLESDPELLGELLQRVSGISDEDFLHRLPALRGAFDLLSTSARVRFLESLAEQLGLEDVHDLDMDLADDAEETASLASADFAGRNILIHLRLDEGLPSSPSREAPIPLPRRELAARSDSAISPLDRWRLILGQERARLQGQAGRAASALDELYGRGHGEGSRGVIGMGGGKEAAHPTVREWSQELEALFGAEVCQEVLGRALEQGRLAAAYELDPSTVRPSMEILERVLSLKGGLADSRAEHLRRLVSRVVEQMTRELAIRLRPALSGLATRRPTRRPGGPLDLGRTISRNLRTAQPDSNGRMHLSPDRFFFRTRGRRSMDWRIILLVDVSGSMEASIIHSAIMASILAGLPAVSVHFVAFSTEILDLTEKVSDPLGLLLEISVGGGTLISLGLRYARSLVTVPSRTILLLVSDFEEGGPIGNMLGELRSLVESGVKTLGIAALDEAGKPRFCVPIAERVVAAGMPVAALTPLELARWVAERVR